MKNRKMKNTLCLITVITMLTMTFSGLTLTSLADDTTIISNQFGYDSTGQELTVYKDSRNTNITWDSEVGGIGGKASDDTSFVFYASDIPTGACKKSAGVKYENLLANDYVFEMNVYFDNAEATVNFYHEDNGYEIIRLLPDGTIMYNHTSAESPLVGIQVESPIKIEPKKWHRLAIWYDGTGGDSARRRYSTYIDGIFISDNSSYQTERSSRIMPGINAYTSSNGFVAFDNFKAYYGTYNPSSIVIPMVEANSEYLAVQDNTITYEPLYITTKSELFDGLEFINATSYRLYTDFSYTTEATDIIDEDYILVVESATGQLSFYTLKLPKIIVDSVDFAELDDSIVATSQVTFEGIGSKEAIMLLIIKDEHGRVEKLYASEIEEISQTPVTFELTAPDAIGKTAEVFFIDGWNSRISYQAVTHKN